MYYGSTFLQACNQRLVSVGGQRTLNIFLGLIGARREVTIYFCFTGVNLLGEVCEGTVPILAPWLRACFYFMVRVYW